MDKDEITEYVHDKKIVEEAIRDEANNEYHEKAWGLIPSEDNIHDSKVYKAAWRAARDD